MTIRFTRHGLDRLRERFSDTDDRAILLRRVAEKLSGRRRSLESGEVEIVVTVCFRRAKVVLATGGADTYWLKTAMWCD